MIESADELVAVISCNTDVFDSSTVKRFATCFENFLKSIAKNPDRKISQFAVLSEAER